MGAILNPYLNFLDGKTREAMEFYQSVLGGELTVMTFGDMGTEGPLASQIMHSALVTPAGFTLYAADAPVEFVQITVGDNVSVSMSGDDPQLRDWFNALMEGGTLSMELAVQPWGDEFGSGTDKFGINWLVNISRPEA